MTAAAVLVALALITEPLAHEGSGAHEPPATAPSADAPVDQPPISESDREGAVRDAYTAAEARRGPLDGRWRLTARDGRALYVFQLSDPGQIADPRSGDPEAPVIEGAWRDPSRTSSAGGSGFLDSVRREGAALSLHFVDHDLARPMVVTLRQKRDGAWAGVLQGAGRRPVTMKRF
jgi:hypothetical protein